MKEITNNRNPEGRHKAKEMGDEGDEESVHGRLGICPANEPGGCYWIESDTNNCGCDVGGGVESVSDNEHVATRPFGLIRTARVG